MDTRRVQPQNNTSLINVLSDVSTDTDTDGSSESISSSTWEIRFDQTLRRSQLLFSEPHPKWVIRFHNALMNEIIFRALDVGDP